MIIIIIIIFPDSDQSQIYTIHTYCIIMLPASLLLVDNYYTSSMRLLKAHFVRLRLRYYEHLYSP